MGLGYYQWYKSHAPGCANEDVGPEGGRLCLRRQYLLAVRLGYYKWYKSHAPGGQPMKTLDLSFHLGCREERNKIRVWKPLPTRRVFGLAVRKLGSSA